MTESFLHYVWQFQYFDKTALLTTAGEPITIYHPGNHNTHAGPDFLQARIRIGEMDWIGNVEIHMQASSWMDHHHDRDSAYDNVILHVVWKEDAVAIRHDGSIIPTLSLHERVSHDLLLRYRNLINRPEQIPCASKLLSVSEVTRVSMLDKALMQRLESRSEKIIAMLRRNNYDWDETSYQVLARNFGFKVNNEAFESLAKALPYKTILKHSDQLLQVEALLFGQGGFLEKQFDDEYYNLLKREYHLLSRKFELSESKLNIAQWKYLRLRPANFPTLRIAQFAALLASRKNIFSQIVEAENFSRLLNLFEMRVSPYWEKHYRFDDAHETELPGFGEASLQNIFINSVAPILVAFGKRTDDNRFAERAIDILQHLKREDNAIIKQWSTMGVRMSSAFDSQAYLELYNEFCLKRRCLDCNIGFAILRPGQ